MAKLGVYGGLSRVLLLGTNTPFPLNFDFSLFFLILVPN